MSVALKIVDQTLGVDPPIRRELRLASERTTLRELIKRRIDEEVADLNAGRDDVRPLVTPTEQERRLNKPESSRRIVDANKQFSAAIEAFERTRIVVIVRARPARRSGRCTWSPGPARWSWRMRPKPVKPSSTVCIKRIRATLRRVN
jgi:hypothetical protein